MAAQPTDGATCKPLLPPQAPLHPHPPTAAQLDTGTTTNRGRGPPHTLRMQSGPGLPGAAAAGRASSARSNRGGGGGLMESVTHREFGDDLKYGRAIAFTGFGGSESYRRGPGLLR